MLDDLSINWSCYPEYRSIALGDILVRLVEPTRTISKTIGVGPLMACLIMVNHLRASLCISSILIADK